MDDKYPQSDSLEAALHRTFLDSTVPGLPAAMLPVDRYSFVVAMATLSAVFLYSPDAILGALGNRVRPDYGAHPRGLLENVNGALEAKSA